MDSNISKFKRLIQVNTIYNVLLSFLLFFCFITIFLIPGWGDEITYHYPNADQISLNRIINHNSSYSSAYTPLAYIIGKIGLLFYNSIITLRLINFIILIILIVFIYKISKEISNEPIYLTLLLLCNPYILRSSFTYYLFNYGLTFSIIGLYYYFFSKKSYNLLLSSIYFALSSFSQQWMLIIPIAIILSEFSSYYLRNVNKKIVITKIIYISFSIIPTIILFIVWKGLTHPNFRSHSLQPSLVHITAALACFGFPIIMIILFRFKDWINIKNIPLLFFIPILFFSIPKFSIHQGIDVMTGIEPQIAKLADKFISLPYPITMLIFSLSGLLFFTFLFKSQENHFLLFIKYSIFGFFLVFSLSTLLGAGHVYLATPFIFLYFNKFITNNKLAKILILTQMYLVSVLYVVYFSKFKVYGLLI